MRAVVLAPLALLALAGCKQAADSGAALQKQEAARAATLDRTSGWDRVFQPDAAVAAANQFGFHAPAVAQVDGAYRTQGGPVMISNSFAAQPNRVAFKAQGAAPDTLDTIAFDLTIADAKDAADARKRLAQLVRDFLFQSKIDARPVEGSIALGRASQGSLAGSRYAIVAQDGDGGAQQLTVTFTRTGASAPANS